MHNLMESYNLILNELREITKKENFYFKPIKPKMSDIELIAISILAEMSSVDSERQLFRDLKGSPLGNKIDRSVYNRRRRKLFPYIEKIRNELVLPFNELEDYFVVDSMPLEVCKIARAGRSKVCKETEYSSPSKGYCESVI